MDTERRALILYLISSGQYLTIQREEGHTYPRKLQLYTMLKGVQ